MRNGIIYMTLEMKTGITSISSVAILAHRFDSMLVRVRGIFHILVCFLFASWLGRRN
jgi:hypothetical protein